MGLRNRGPQKEQFYLKLTLSAHLWLQITEILFNFHLFTTLFNSVVCCLLTGNTSTKNPCFVFCIDAFFTTAKPESAITNISEHERQFQTSPASQQSMYPN